MGVSKLQRNLILGVLFFLPVTFLLFLYPAQHNYNTLDIVKAQVDELAVNTNQVTLKNNITIVNFPGKNPLNNLIAVSNLKELIYDKFKGFKKFQVVSVMPKEAEVYLPKLKQELINYDELKYWQFVFLTETEIEQLFLSLHSEEPLQTDLSSPHVFIVDKELSQRGRIDDREDKDIQKNKPIFPLYSYNTVEVKETKDKLSDDLRILFTEYRQKRKGNFNSTSRRADDLKQ